MEMADHLGEGENYTRISNEILEALAKAKLNGTQYAICLVVCRKTFGFQSWEAKISASYISEVTGINLRHVKRELQELADRQIILKIDQRDGVTSTLSFNRDISAWQPVSKKSPVDKPVTNPSPVPVSKKSPEPVTNPSPNKESKEKVKEIYILSARQIFDHWNHQSITVHKELTKDIEKTVVSALSKFNLPTIKLAITRYATVYNDQNYYFSHKWTLVNFLKQRNGISDFLDEGEKWINYQAQRGSPKNKGYRQAVLDKMM